MADPPKLEDQWWSRDRPVLLAIAEKQMREAGSFATGSLRVEGLSGEEINQAAVALMPSFVDGRAHRDGSGRPYAVMINGLTERGRREVGFWPDGGTAVDQLLSALRQAEELTDDPDDKTALHKAGGQLASVSRSVVAEVVAAVIARQTGISG